MPDRITQENVVFAVQEHQRWLERIDARTEDVNVIRQELAEARKDISNLERKLDANRRAVIGFALSIAGAAVVFGLSVLALLHG